MFDSTRNYAPRPAETSRVVDAINVINTPPARRKKSFPKTVVALFLIVLTVLAVKYAPVSAGSPVTFSPVDQQPHSRLAGNLPGMTGEHTLEMSR